MNGRAGAAAFRRSPSSAVYEHYRRTRTLDVPRVVRSRGAAAFAIQTIRYTTGEELIRRERRASSKVLYMSRMTEMTDAVVVRSRRGAL